MFDWDQDLDEAVAPRVIPVYEPAVAQARPGTGGRLAVLLGVPVLAALGWGGVQWSGVTVWSSASAPVAVSVAAFGGARLTGAPDAGNVATAMAPLPPLQVYGPEQIAAFQAGIARFSADDLRAHVAGTAAQLGDGSGPLAPFLSDALALARHEMARRGIADPGAGRP